MVKSKMTQRVEALEATATVDLSDLTDEEIQQQIADLCARLTAAGLPLEPTSPTLHTTVAEMKAMLSAGA